MQLVKKKLKQYVKKSMYFVQLRIAALAQELVFSCDTQMAVGSTNRKDDCLGGIFCT